MRNISGLLALVTTAGLVLAWAAGAAGHGFTSMYGYVSTVSGVDPLVLGVTARVLQGDDRLRVSSLGRQTIVILGYEREPYLRFTPRGVWENVNSPAVYRNRDRWAVAVVPDSATARAKPRWRRVSRVATWEWHDHRIHWMRKGQTPRVIQAEPRQQHKVFDWRVPARADGKPFAITGFLGYAPPLLVTSDDSNTGRMVMWAAAGGTAVVTAAAAFLLLRRRRAHPVAPHPGGEAGSTRHPPGA